MGMIAAREMHSMKWSTTFYQNNSLFDNNPQRSSISFNVFAIIERKPDIFLIIRNQLLLHIVQTILLF